LPFQVNKAAWIEKMADLVNQGKIEGIDDLRDESDRTGMRVVIELKKGVEPENILEKLYKHTDLQKNFGVTLLALVNNKPVQLSLRQLLEEFLKFREETVTRQYSHELGECQKRLHLLEGLLIALNNLDQLIDILRHAADGTTAKVQLESRLEITPEQADSILAMPMRRITGLERQKIDAESQELQARIAEFETLLNDRHERLKTLKKELRKLKKTFGDERRTRITKTPYVPPKKVAEPASPPPITDIISPEDAIADPEIIVTEDAIADPINIEVTLSEFSNAPVNVQDSEEAVLEDHPVNLENQDLILTEPEPNSPEKLKKNPAFSLFTPQIPPDDAELAVTLSGEVYWTLPNQELAENDPIIYQTPIHQQEQIIVVSDRGKAYPILIKEIPPVTIARLPLLELLSKTAQRDAEKIVGQFFLPEPTTNQDLLLISQNGRLKRLKLNEFTELTNRGLGLIKFKEEGDRIQSIHLVRSEEDLVLATSSGRLLRFSLKEENIPPMGRNAQGNPALRLRFGESLVGCLSVNAGDQVLLITQLGYGKSFSIQSLRLGILGDIGTTAMQFSNKTDQLIGMMPDSQNLLLLTNQNRQISLSNEAFNIWTKDGVGDRLVELETDELINRVILN
jgi:DNA gyrase subunit A